jgi:hypothetical protein
MRRSERHPQDLAVETTPLLAEVEPQPIDESATLGESSANHNNESTTDGDDNEDNDAEAEEDEPLPYKQIVILCCARLVEPIGFFCIFPFVNQMIQETGNLDEADVGFYSGLIVSHGQNA